jgi:hypothetical protein
MPLDIFGRSTPLYGGTFAADAAVCSFGGLAGGGVGLLTQQIQFSYTQRVTRLYEIGTNYTFYVVGRSAGELAVQRVLGPRPVSLAFYQAYGNPCSTGNTLLFSIGVGCNTPGDLNAGFNLLLTGVLITTISISVRAEDMIVAESLQMLYVALLPS